MKFFLSIMMFLQISWGADATLEVVKGVEGLASLAIEDGSYQPNDSSRKFMQMLAADMNVISMFTVNETYSTCSFESITPSAIHKDAQYLLRYQLADDGMGGIKADIKLLQNGREIFLKNYILKQTAMSLCFNI